MSSGFPVAELVSFLSLTLCLDCPSSLDYPCMTFFWTLISCLPAIFDKKFHFHLNSGLLLDPCLPRTVKPKMLISQICKRHLSNKKKHSFNYYYIILRGQIPCAHEMLKMQKNNTSSLHNFELFARAINT